MTATGKSWHPALVVADGIELQAEIVHALTVAGFSEVDTSSLDDAESTLTARAFNLLVVSWVHRPDEAAELVMKMKERAIAVLSILPHLDQQVVHALKAGSDSVMVYPKDLDHIALPALLAFDRARIRGRELAVRSEVSEAHRLGSARIRSIIHDLKNPLTVTMGNLQVIQSNPPDTISDDVRRMVANALRGCRLQLNMMTNLSDLIKLEEGRYLLRLEAVDPEPMLRNKIAEFTTTDARKNYALESLKSVPVVADSSLLDRVFHNLLSHAAHYTRDGNHISVALDYLETDNKCVITVADDGEPIPRELGDGIFDSAGGALDNREHTRWDRGMMLAFSRLALRSMGGDAALDGLPEVGARICVTLPAVSKDSAANVK
jgi:K+-sensing histidine kinase KdpD